MRMLLLSFILLLHLNANGQDFPYEVGIIDLFERITTHRFTTTPTENGYLLRNFEDNCFYYGRGDADPIPLICDSLKYEANLSVPGGLYIDAFNYVDNMYNIYHVSHDDPVQKHLVVSSLGRLTLINHLDSSRLLYSDEERRMVLALDKGESTPQVLFNDLTPVVLSQLAVGDYIFIMTPDEILVTNGTPGGSQVLYRRENTGGHMPPISRFEQFVRSGNKIYYEVLRKIYRYDVVTQEDPEVIPFAESSEHSGRINQMVATRAGVVLEILDERGYVDSLITIDNEDQVARNVEKTQTTTLHQPELLGVYAGKLVLLDYHDRVRRLFVSDGTAEEAILIHGNVYRTSRAQGMAPELVLFTGKDEETSEELMYAYDPVSNSVNVLKHHYENLKVEWLLGKTDNGLYFTDQFYDQLSGDRAIYRLDLLSFEVAKVIDSVEVAGAHYDQGSDQLQLYVRDMTNDLRLLIIDTGIEISQDITLDHPSDEQFVRVGHSFQSGDFWYYTIEVWDEGIYLYRLDRDSGASSLIRNLVYGTSNDFITGIYAAGGEAYVRYVNGEGRLNNGIFTETASYSIWSENAIYIGKIGSNPYVQNFNSLMNLASGEQIYLRALLGVDRVDFVWQGIAVDSYIYLIVQVEDRNLGEGKHIGLVRVDPILKVATFVGRTRSVSQQLPTGFLPVLNLAGKLYYALPSGDGPREVITYRADSSQLLDPVVTDLLVLDGGVAGSHTAYYSQAISAADTVVTALSNSGRTNLFALSPGERLIEVVAFGKSDVVVTSMRLFEVSTRTTLYWAEDNFIIRGAKELPNEIVITASDATQLLISSYRGLEGRVATILTENDTELSITMPGRQVTIGNQLFFAVQSGEQLTYYLYDGGGNRLFTVGSTYTRGIGLISFTNQKEVLNLAAANNGSVYYIFRNKFAGVSIHHFQPRSSSLLSGRVFVDVNESGIYERGEPLVPQARIVAEGEENIITFTDSTGEYQLYPNHGVEYTVVADPFGCYHSRSGEEYTFISSADTVIRHDGCISRFRGGLLT
jgi:hypothetical protein